MTYVDMHCDTLTTMMDDSARGDLFKNNLSVDFSRLSKIERPIQFFACFVNLQVYMDRYGNFKIDRAWDYACRMLRYFKDHLHYYPGCYRLIQKAADVDAFLAGGKKAAPDSSAEAAAPAPEDTAPLGVLLTVEEGGILGGSMKRLESLHRRGVRLITLTWNHANCLGYPNSWSLVDNMQGLKPFGFEVISWMERRGMIVDVSHLSDGGFYDVARTMKKPFVASHSNARAVCDHPRNLSDEMLKVLAEHGGVTGLNFCPEFLDKDKGSTIEAMVRHVKHMINVAGEDVVALGTDFDGIGGPLEISSVDEMPKLYEALERSGLTGRMLDKLWYQNAVRVMKDTLR